VAAANTIHIVNPVGQRGRAQGARLFRQHQAQRRTVHTGLRGNAARGFLTSFSKKLLKLYADFDPSRDVPSAGEPEHIVMVVMGGTGTHSLSVQTRLASENVRADIAQRGFVVADYEVTICF
jgi:hypothetical protein